MRSGLLVDGAKTARFDELSMAVHTVLVSSALCTIIFLFI